MSYESPERRKARLEAELYEREMGKPPPAPVEDWQLNYRGTKEERARLRAWMGVADGEEQERGPQPEQESSLF